LYFVTLLKHISKIVWLLGFVSLFTDMASEMLYPVMPIYLKSIGFSIVLIGVLEGIAEAVAGLSKGYFGKMSDNMGRRLPFVQIGYGLSALSKPLMAMSIIPLYVFGIRTLDRLGKGIRTGARDAILNAEATPETKGRVFGFHKSMDTLGAAIGPAIALVFLYFYPAQYKTLFFIAVIPGVFSIIASLLIKEKNTISNAKNYSAKHGFLSFISYWKTSTAHYRKIILGLLFFALLNTSDVFLLLKATEMGLNDMQTIGIYIFYNLVYTLFAYPLGILADRWQMKNVFILGLLLFSVVYVGMAFAQSIFVITTLFFIYGLFAAATEGVAKAWIGTEVQKSEMGTAVGFYTSFQSICSMLASSVGGLLWYYNGSAFTFMVSGIGALAVAIYFNYFLPSKETK
jgi:MFS family permease